MVDVHQQVLKSLVQILCLQKQIVISNSYALTYM